MNVGISLILISAGALTLATVSTIGIIRKHIKRRPPIQGAPTKGWSRDDLSLPQHEPHRYPVNILMPGGIVNTIACPQCHSVRVGEGRVASDYKAGQRLSFFLATVGPLTLAAATKLYCLECGNIWKEKAL